MEGWSEALVAGGGWTDGEEVERRWRRWSHTQDEAATAADLVREEDIHKHSERCMLGTGHTQCPDTLKRFPSRPSPLDMHPSSQQMYLA